MQSNGSVIEAKSEGGGPMTRFSTYKIFSRSIQLWWLTASLLLMFAAMDRAAQCATAPNRVVIAYPSPTPRVAPLWLAQDLDFFGKYNLAAQIVLVRNNQMLAAGLAAGDIDIGYTGGTTVLGAAAAGVELRLVAGFVSRGRGYLVVRPDIKKAQDLAGKRIGVQSIGGTLWMYVMLTLDQLGVDTARDNIRLLVIGDQTVIARALESQVVDAAVLTTRTYLPGLKQKGFSVLSEVTPAMAATGIVTRKSYLQKNSEVLENIMKALIEGEHYMMSPGGKAQSIKTIMSRLKLTDVAVAEEGHADAIKEFDLRPFPSIEGLKNMQRLLAMQNPRLADVNAASLVDVTLVRKLEESGFFTQLQTRYRE